MRTPGIRPWSASLRKQIRQMPNLRYTARARPHILQRRLSRVVNFGVSLALANFALLATIYSQVLLSIVSRPVGSCIESASTDDGQLTIHK